MESVSRRQRNSFSLVFIFWLWGRNAERGKKAVDEIRTTGGRADFIPSEFRGADSAREVARKAIELGNGHLQKHRANSGSPNSR